MAHTLGPWSAVRSQPDEGADVWWITACPSPNGEKELGTVWGGHPTSAANANLIAAAPDLLEALKALTEVCEKQPRISKAFPEPGSPLGLAHAAISKATGGAS